VAGVLLKYGATGLRNFFEGAKVLNLKGLAEKGQWRLLKFNSPLSDTLFEF
jgi:hypothetical protein